MKFYINFSYFSVLFLLDDENPVFKINDLAVHIDNHDDNYLTDEESVSLIKLFLLFIMYNLKYYWIKLFIRLKEIT